MHLMRTFLPSRSLITISIIVVVLFEKKKTSAMTFLFSARKHSNVLMRFIYTFRFKYYDTWSKYYSQELKVHLWWDLVHYYSFFFWCNNAVKSHRRNTPSSPPLNNSILSRSWRRHNEPTRPLWPRNSTRHSASYI